MEKKEEAKTKSRGKAPTINIQLPKKNDPIITQLYDGEITLVFDPVKHVYSINGRKIVGTTSISGQLDKSGPLMWWAVGQALAHIDEKLIVGEPLDEVEKATILDDAKSAHRRSSTKAATIGSLAHEWAEHYIKAKLNVEGYEMPKMPRHKAVKSAVDAFLAWELQHEVLFIESERMVYSKENDFAGQLDADGYVDGIRSIIDFKTSNSIYDEMLLQTGGYWGARVEEWTADQPLDQPWKQRVIARFGKVDGQFESKVFTENERDYAAFLLLRKLYDWKRTAAEALKQ